MDYIYDPNVCPSSLGEDGKPMTEGETAHKWYREGDTFVCAECGTTKEAKFPHDKMVQLTKVLQERLDIQVNNIEDGKMYTHAEYLDFAIEEAWQNGELDFLTK